MPLLITENGAAFPTSRSPTGPAQVHDTDRIDYLDGTSGRARAIAPGVDLRGYFVWSLMDNFEWA